MTIIVHMHAILFQGLTRACCLHIYLKLIGFGIAVLYSLYLAALITFKKMEGPKLEHSLYG